MLNRQQTFRLFLFLLVLCKTAFAQTFVRNGPPGSEKFGHSVVVLKNGNYVITDPFHDEGGVSNVGAVYLYKGSDHTLISRLVGSSANDQVGLAGVTALPSGDFVVRSPNWKNGSASKAGAVTQLNGETGFDGIVSISNSLVGSTAHDQIGLDLSFVSTAITLVGDSKYVVRSPLWDNSTIVDAGAVTLISSASFTPGAISITNSLVGSHAADKVGQSDLKVLTNGNLVISSPNWDNNTVVDVGAVTFVNMVSGLTGAISENNSLIGTTASDQVGFQDVIELSNGNYVVRTPLWNNASIADVGAVTLCNGTIGRTGVIGEGNSLIGSAVSDKVGLAGVVALTNGNYVVLSPLWDNASVADAGAATWCNGNIGTVGQVNVSNSLVGSSQNDQIGSGGVASLTNGNYVVVSSIWDNGSIVDAGAATWGNGNIGITGVININNSLVGSSAGDQVGTRDLWGSCVRPLTDGNYVVASSSWDNGSIANVGAVTWGDGSGGVVGVPSSANSIIGSRVDDKIGISGVFSIAGGGYVILSPGWDRENISDAGAATMVSGASRWTGEVSAANSFVGNSEIKGVASGFTALPNGTFVLRTRYIFVTYGSNNHCYRTAFTWWDPADELIGEVSQMNSLIGSNDVGQSGYAVPIGNGGEWIASWLPVDCSSIDGFGFSGFTWSGGTKETNVTGVAGSLNSQVAGGGVTEIESGGGVHLLNDDSFLMVGAGMGSLSLNGGKIFWGTLSSSLGGTSGCIVDDESAYYSRTYDLPDFSFASANKYLVLGYWQKNKVKIYYPNSSPLTTEQKEMKKIISKNGKVTIESSNCATIASIHSTGDNPVTGEITFNTWIEGQIPTFGGVPFVARHYQITPKINPASSTGRVTLYFTKKEFEDFNGHAGSALNLPENAGDAAGKSHLRITKVSGASIDATGLPGSYGNGASTIINPNDENIVWNEILQRWEVTFDVTGFSGFFVHTNPTALPVRVLSFKAGTSEADAKLDWEIADAENFSHFEIERSVDAKKFESVGNIDWLMGLNKYHFTDAQALFYGDQLYYRLKLIDADGTFAYSRIEAVKFDGTLKTQAYPNPFLNKVTIQVTEGRNTPVIVTVYSQNGKVVSTQQKNMVDGRVELNFEGSSIPNGVYLFSVQTGNKTFFRRLIKGK